MTIVALNKVSLCGLMAEKDKILEQLQRLGGTHLIPLNAAVKKSGDDLLDNRGDAQIALKYLQQCKEKRHQVTQTDEFEFSSIIADILKVKRTLESLLDERESLQARIKEVSLWGDFNLAEKDDLLGYYLWFYIVPKNSLKSVYQSDLIWQQINQSNTHAYIVVIAKEEPDKKAMPVDRTHIGDISLSNLHKRLEALELAIEDAYAQRTYLTRWIFLIMQNLAEFESHSELTQAQQMTQDESELFVVQFWLPSEHRSQIEKFIADYQLACLFELPNGVEQPPTLLKNSDTFAGAEECVKFYQTPNYYSWDPSIVVFFSFALFFAMILSDAGYATLFLAMLAFKWKAMGKAKQGQRFRILLLVTLMTSLIWGIAVGSYFGITPATYTVLGHLKVIEMNDFDAMMHISITIGVIHIILANLVQAYQLKQQTTRFASLGWAFLTAGGYLLFEAMGRNSLVLERGADVLLGLAAMLILFFSSDRPLKKPIDLFYRLIKGIMRLFEVTKIFGDVLSYMRLFALGLASASLAITFNHLAIQVYDALPGLGLWFAILILIVGHLLNILLGIMSGVVHGLRLNFIEFYNWSVSDEGYPFKEFSKKEGY